MSKYSNKNRPVILDPDKMKQYKEIEKNQVENLGNWILNCGIISQPKEDFECIDESFLINFLKITKEKYEEGKNFTEDEISFDLNEK